MTGRTDAQILVVDDEPTLRRAVGAALRTRGYTVHLAANGAEALDHAVRHPLDAIVLDLGLPDLDGIEVCRRIREWSTTPIIVLTVEDTEDRKVLALDQGADDFVTKPFSMPELLARVRVALRHHAAADPGTEPAVLEVGDLAVDLGAHRVRVGERPVELTPKEFDFLALLARHPGRVHTHRAILQAVWGPAYGTETQYLRVYASQLRKKLADDPARPRLVTEPGVGYRLVDPAVDEPRS
ncbi:MAG: response regulator transcription factor [Actinomycetes bacterium]